MPLENIIDCLKKSGHKITPQRIAIIKIVSGSKAHLTPLALYNKVHQIKPDIGEVTVYRTLNILSELGLVCTLHTAENTHSYISGPPEHHGHLICLKCGKVLNFSGGKITELEDRLRIETGFKIHKHRLDLYGLCNKCSTGNISNKRINR